jgi:NAD(P)-dependent dehydrogenase (short-subunit alcohol dehydrogenase family)
LNLFEYFRFFHSQRGGSVVLVSSAMHVMGIPGHTTYAATKAALRSYARTWAAEFKDRGIRVNTLSPGVTDTPILDSQSAARDGVALIFIEPIRDLVPLSSLRHRALTRIQPELFSLAGRYCLPLSILIG